MTSLTDTQVVTASGGLVELGYAESNANLAISATTGAGMDNISPELTVVCDGSPVMVEFFCATARATTSGSGTTDALWFTLKVDGSVQVERLGTVGNVTTSYGSLFPIRLSHRMTPSAGSHTFRVGGWVSNAARTGYIGGGSPYPPAWIRVSKIVQATQWPAVQTSTIICTSSTRPASPFEGQKIYETDTNREWKWDGAAWRVADAGKYVRVTRTASLSNVTSTTWVAVDTALDMTVAASVGDLLEVTFDGVLCYNSAHDMYIDAHTLVGSTPTNSFATGGAINASGRGISSWSSQASVYAYNGGNCYYKVVSGDISNGTVTVRIYNRATGVGGKQLYVSSDQPMTFHLRNLGPTTA